VHSANPPENHGNTRPETKNNKIADQPGECVLVDSIESSTARLTLQIKGTLTNKRYLVV